MHQVYIQRRAASIERASGQSTGQQAPGRPLSAAAGGIRRRADPARPQQVNPAHDEDGRSRQIDGQPQAAVQVDRQDRVE